MADRTDWDTATRHQRHLAVAADAELRRRHPGQHFPPLRSAEPEPATQAQRDELTLTPGQPPADIGQWIKDLAAGHRTFADRLADRQSQRIPPKTPTTATSARHSPPGPDPARTPSCNPPSPRSRRPRTSSSAPQTATPTGKPQNDSNPAHPHVANPIFTDLTTRPSASAHLHAPPHGCRDGGRAHVSYRDRMSRPHLRVHARLNDSGTFSSGPARSPGIGTFIRRITGIVMAARERGNGC